jgi:hypothetical protein
MSGMVVDSKSLLNGSGMEKQQADLRWIHSFSGIAFLGKVWGGAKSQRLMQMEYQIPHWDKWTLARHQPESGSDCNYIRESVAWHIGTTM